MALKKSREEREGKIAVLHDWKLSRVEENRLNNFQILNGMEEWRELETRIKAKETHQYYNKNRNKNHSKKSTERDKIGKKIII